jgi:hypothetical protein
VRLRARPKARSQMRLATVMRLDQGTLGSIAVTSTLSARLPGGPTRLASSTVRLFHRPHGRAALDRRQPRGILISPEFSRFG